MAILTIIKDGDPTLRKHSRPVTEITPRIIRLIDDMRDTLKKSGGVGLAAVQVGVLRRVVLVEDAEGKVLELINPEIIAREGEQHELEGCLSVPDKWGITDRPEKVTVRALDREGKEFTVSGEGLTARCFCHELDHLEGILFSDHARMLTEEELEAMTEEE
ncbi:MAG: peptide deformylase [Clostridia bacterium]|nr:peptide deformylase [Clostridia bacterium]